MHLEGPSVCFTFFVRRAGASRRRNRKEDPEGWQEFHTPELASGISILKALEESRPRISSRGLDFFSQDGRRIEQDLLLGAIPLPWFAQGISVVPRKSARVRVMDPSSVQEIFSCPDEGWANPEEKV